MTGDNNSSNTGYRGYTTLEKYYTDNGAATGQTKANVEGDPDYIPLTYDTVNCPLPYFTAVKYDSYSDAFNQVNGIATNLYTHTNSFVEGARIYTNQDKTIYAPHGFYRRLDQIRNTTIGFYDGFATTALGPIASAPNSCINTSLYLVTGDSFHYSFGLSFANQPVGGYTFNVIINGTTSGASSTRAMNSTEVISGNFSGDTNQNNGIAYMNGETITITVTSFVDGPYNHVQC